MSRSARAMLRIALLGAITFGAFAAFGACGGAASQQRITKVRAGGGAEQPRLPPVATEATTAFDEGMRWLRAADVKKRANERREALDKAATAFRRAVDADPNVWEAWHNLGVIHFADGDDDAATDAFGLAIKVNPAHIAALLGRAEAHRRAGRTREARTDYESAVANSPTDGPTRGDATARLASLLREARAYDDALAVIRDTLRTSGANATVYVELGMVYMAQDRRDLAALVLGKAAEINAKEPSIYNAYALLALAQGRSQEAFERFDQATSLDPSYLDARFNKASVLLDAGDYARAKQELAAVVTQNPDDMGAQVTLGVAHRGLGEYDQAKAIWEKVVQEAPRRSRVRGDALFNLAVLQMSFLEDEKGAAAAFDRFLQEAPRSHPKRKTAEEKKKELGL
jgi:tetratricopeptide (TPR) repeat protein